MSTRWLDTLTERRERALIVADVRAFDPKVKVGDARLTIMSGYRSHAGGDRWMEWSYDGVELKGYYHSAHGAHVDGWREWLARQMTPTQEAAYQDGNDRGWMKPSRRTPR